MPYNKEQAKAYYQRNKERIIARVKAHYEATRGEQVAYRKEYYRQNKKKLLAYMAEYRELRKSDPAYLESRRVSVAKCKAKLKSDAFAAYGNRCACCGEDHEDFLSIDHVHGDGNVHRKELGHKHFYQWLKEHNYPKDRFQLLCMNCNWAKGVHGQCPHEAERARSTFSIIQGMAC